MRLLASLLIIISLTGCASKLEVYDSSKNKAKGVPVHIPQLVQVTTVTKYKVAKGSEKYKDLCTPETITSFDLMPLGERYYITFDPASLGDGEFSIEFTDKGLLKSVTLNSKASAGAEQANSLLSTVLPYAASPKPIPAPMSLVGTDETAQKLKEKHCIKSSSKVTSISKVDMQ